MTEFNALTNQDLRNTSKLLGADSSDLTTAIRYNYPNYVITDTSIDQADASAVGSLAWIYAQVNAITAAADRRATVIFGPGEFDFDSSGLEIYENLSVFASSAGDTQLNFNSTAGLKFSNGEIHAASTSYSVGDYVFPSGIVWPHRLRFRCTVAGTSGATATFDTNAAANLNPGDTFTDGGCTWETVVSIKPVFGNFSYDMSATMTEPGIAVQKANTVRVLPLIATGGNTTAKNWAIEFENINRFKIEMLDLDIDCNGLQMTTRNNAIWPYNYGDGIILAADIACATAATVGMKFLGSDTTSNVINNILVDRYEFVGSGDVADVHVGMWFEHARRNTVHHYDCEQANVAVMEISIGGGSCDSNCVKQLHFLPNSGAQGTEGTEYARGVPFSEGSTTTNASNTQVKVRENWLDYEPFDAWPRGNTTGYIADDEGAYTRDVTAVGSPSGGFVELTVASAIPASGRSNIDRHPVIAPSTSHASNTSMQAGLSAKNAEFILPGDIIKFAAESGFNYRSVMLQQTSNTTAAMRNVKDVADGVTFDVSNIKIGPESSSDTMTINSLQAGDELTAEPSTTFAGMIVRADGTTWNPGSGAGTYLRNAADSAWVFLG